MAEDEAPSEGVVSGMRELLEFHTADELKQLIETVLDDQNVPQLAVGGDSDLADPATPFAAAAGGPVSEEPLVRLRAVMAAGADKADLVELVFEQLLGPSGPWGGSERGYRMLVSRCWEGIAIEYLRQRGGLAKPPSYKSNVRLMVIERWKAAESLEAARQEAREARRAAAKAGRQSAAAEAVEASEDSSNPTEATAQQSVFAEPGGVMRTALADNETPSASSSSSTAEEGATAASLAAQRRAEALFDSWWADKTREMAEADETVRAAERRVRLGRDATAVLDFLGAMRVARRAERELRAALAARCRRAEAAAAALAGGGVEALA